MSKHMSAIDKIGKSKHLLPSTSLFPIIPEAAVVVAAMFVTSPREHLMSNMSVTGLCTSCGVEVNCSSMAWTVKRHVVRHDVINDVINKDNGIVNVV